METYGRLGERVRKPAHSGDGGPDVWMKVSQSGDDLITAPGLEIVNLDSDVRLSRRKSVAGLSVAGTAQYPRVCRIAKGPML